MELFFFLLDLLLGFLDLSCLIADIYSWIQGRANRVERREARKSGSEIPPRDKWNRRVIWLTVYFIAITTAWLLWKWLVVG